MPEYCCVYLLEPNSSPLGMIWSFVIDLVAMFNLLYLVLLFSYSNFLKII